MVFCNVENYRRIYKPLSFIPTDLSVGSGVLQNDDSRPSLEVFWCKPVKWTPVQRVEYSLKKLISEIYRNSICKSGIYYYISHSFIQHIGQWTLMPYNKHHASMNTSQW